MTTEEKDNQSMEDSSTEQVPHQEMVPFEFFNMKFWLVLFLIINAFLLLPAIFNTIGKPSILSVIMAILIIGEFVFWIVGLRLWFYAKVLGFWLIFALIHLLFVTQVFMLAKSINQRRSIDKPPPQATFSDARLSESFKQAVQVALSMDRERREAAKKMEANTTIGLRAIALFLILYCFFLNIWSRRLLAFFKKINGVCPLCHRGSLVKKGQIRKNRSWKCNACSQDVLWKAG